ncbi:hypothetical protein [Gracilibacillus dipsosauri]|jgi:aldehyde:ferredoxin oxidoreductase|uniref:hypothetical protein n=1 Tax=Gracilibacillus dipsosauri TaxID=178340 RepID=UPI0024099DED
MPKHHIALTENDIARIINGEEIIFKVKGEEIIVRQSYAKDIIADMLIRQNRVMNTASNTFEY